MVRNFIIVRSFCEFCAEIIPSNTLAMRPSDIIYAGSGDPREKMLERTLGRISKQRIPIGIWDKHLINSSRDFNFMYSLFKKMEVE